MTRYTDDDLDRIESEAEAMLAEARGTLKRADELFKFAGLDEDESVSGFLSNQGSSTDLDALREEHIGDLDRAVMEEEKRLMRETRDTTPAPPRRRRVMARV